eukprot:TRINITY_DN2981_c0_g1_i4.p1 TRINITY_DN2981_c0_g1~~TRINITY_DN2981_c0_g1_i4.p1  ORF type:complete len:290 (+),score=34.26 TRINITY_DN2981_c0_g1_i4:172-1041(+)
MSAWSHIVRVRHAWEHYLRDNTELQWLFLLDDDVYMLIENMCWALNRPMLFHTGSVDTGNNSHAQHNTQHTTTYDIKQHSTQQYTTQDTFFLIAFKWGGLLELLPYDWAHQPNVIPRPSSITVPGSGNSNKQEPRWSGYTVPQGAIFFVNRQLVGAVYPYLDRCERETAEYKLKSWGSQRLWACVYKYMLPDLGTELVPVSRHQPTTINDQSQIAQLNWMSLMSKGGPHTLHKNSRLPQANRVISFHHLTSEHMFKLHTLHQLYQSENIPLCFKHVLSLFPGAKDPAGP